MERVLSSWSGRPAMLPKRRSLPGCAGEGNSGSWLLHASIQILLAYPSSHRPDFQQEKHAHNCLANDPFWRSQISFSDTRAEKLFLKSLRKSRETSLFFLGLAPSLVCLAGPGWGCFHFRERMLGWGRGSGPGALMVTCKEPQSALQFGI